MSQKNVELIEALLPDPSTDIVPLFRDEDTFVQMRDALSPFITVDFQHVMRFPAETRTNAGLEGLRKNWLDWLEPWATYRSTLEKVEDIEGQVWALFRNHGRRAGMEIEIELMAAATFAFREGKLARWEDYTDRAEALQAMGLSE